MALLFTAALGISALGMFDPFNCSAFCKGRPANLSTAVPNVMLLSDSIGAQGSGYFTNVRAMLGPGPDNGSAVLGGGILGNALVQHTGSYGGGICGTSYGVVACADFWLGEQLYDVIHFNWGLHDICAKMYAPVTPEQYAANMEALYQRLRAHLRPKGTLIWSTTTPVPPSYHNRNNSDVLRINAQMAALFGPAGKHPEVVLSDMYGAVVQRCNRETAVATPSTCRLTRQLSAEECVEGQNWGCNVSSPGGNATGLWARGGCRGEFQCGDSQVSCGEGSPPHPASCQIADCRRAAEAPAVYPQSADCDVLQSRGVHFSDAGKQYTGIIASSAIAPFL